MTIPSECTVTSDSWCKALEAEGLHGLARKVKTHSYRGFTINMWFGKTFFVTENGSGLHQLDTTSLHLRVMQWGQWLSIRSQLQNENAKKGYGTHTKRLLTFRLTIRLHKHEKCNLFQPPMEEAYICFKNKYIVALCQFYFVKLRLTGMVDIMKIYLCHIKW